MKASGARIGRTMMRIPNAISTVPVTGIKRQASGSLMPNTS